MFTRGSERLGIVLWLVAVTAQVQVSFANLTIDVKPPQPAWGTATQTGIPQVPSMQEWGTFSADGLAGSDNCLALIHVNPAGFTAHKTQPISSGLDMGLFGLIGVTLAFFARYKNTIAAMILGVVNFGQAGMKLSEKTSPEVSPTTLPTHITPAVDNSRALTQSRPLSDRILKSGRMVIAPAIVPTVFNLDFKPGRTAWRQPSIEIVYINRKSGHWNTTRGPPPESRTHCEFYIT
jgi:hypothetical protein